MKVRGIFQKQQEEEISNSKIAINNNFEYLLVLDFEATCDNSSKIFPQVGNFFFYFRKL